VEVYAYVNVDKKEWDSGRGGGGFMGHLGAVDLKKGCRWANELCVWACMRMCLRV
jgi:hypothetical protein